MSPPSGTAGIGKTSLVRDTAWRASQRGATVVAGHCYDVAAGCSTAEIADRLYISRRTVTTHISSLYGKFGVNTRAALTRFAVEHQLV